MAIYTLGIQESFKLFANNGGTSTDPVNMVKYVSDRFAGKLTVNISGGTSVSNSYVSSGGTNDYFLQVINNGGSAGRGGSYLMNVSPADQKGKIVLGCRIKRPTVVTGTVYFGGFIIGGADNTLAASAATEAFIEIEADFVAKKMNVYMNSVLSSSRDLDTGGSHLTLIVGSHPWSSGKGYALNEAVNDTCRLSDGYVSIDLPDDPNPTGRLGPIVLDFSSPVTGSSSALLAAGQATAKDVGVFSATPAVIGTSVSAFTHGKQSDTYRPGMQVAMVAFEMAAGKADPTSPSKLEMSVYGGSAPVLAGKSLSSDLDTVIRTKGQLVLKPEDFDGGLDLRETFTVQIKAGR
ncbi:hypothetical protein [Acinetobacter phage ABPH49]|nr:hypothetical protein [Acinetobacter phage ABPH49]